MKKIWFSIALLLVGVTCIIAQTSTGRLSGTVSGPDGVLPGATVLVTDNQTGKELTTTANDSGSYTFPQLDAGTYTVKITVSGFKTFIANELKIDVGREYSLNPALEIGAVQETVNVTAGADVITATTAQVSNTVSPQQILALPLITRNPLTLTTLQSGVQSNPFQNTTINGMRTSFTNITRDGINIQDNFIRSNATDFAPGRPSVDDTAEFTIITGNQEADQGYGGAQIRLTTPRGTKDFRGALFAYNRNSAFAANNFFSNRSGAELPFRNRNQFGGKIGGPVPLPSFGEGGPIVYKDKGFFFFNYEKIIDPVSGAVTRTILTPSARSGAFRYNRTIAGSPINSGGVSCPSGAVGSVCTITDFLAFARASNLPNTAGSPIPATISPIVQSRIISQLPTESNFTGGDGLNTAGFFLNRAADNEGTRATGRIDVEPTEKDSITGVYSYNFETNIRNDLDGSGFTPIPRGSQTSGNKTLSLAYRRIISPNIVNEVRGGLFFSDVPFQRDIPNPSDYLLSVPLVSNPENNFQNQGRTVKTYNIQDNLDVIVGKHSLRFGGQLQYFRPTANNFAGTFPTVGLGTINGVTPAFVLSNFASAGGINNAQLGTANGLLALLGGIVTSAQQTFNLNSINDGFQQVGSIQPFQYENYSAYGADRWQITNDLTLNLGVRYEIFPGLRLGNGLALEPVITDPDNPEASILNPNGTYRPIGANGNSGRENAYYKTDYNNFAPNVGFAYAPKFERGIGKLMLGNTAVIRGGFSRAFGNDQIVTGIDNAGSGNVGLASRNGFILNPADGTSNLNLRLGTDGIPAIPAPTFVAPPFTFIRNNTSGISSTNNFGTVFAIDPNLQTPSIDQYSLGVQREFGGNMALEIRYVGTRSDNLPRAVDLNQIDIFNNGFLADFNRASANLALTGNAFCTTAGCQPLSIFTNTGASGPGRIRVGGTGALTLATLNANLQNGTPADLATTLITQGFNNHPTLNNPNGRPFVNFVANPSTGVVDLFGNDARYRYNSLQVELRRRFSQGLFFQANYTFSKNLSNGQGNTQAQFEPFLDNNNPDLDYQRADTDQTHTFNFNGAYQLPFGKGRTFFNQGGIIDKIFGGFELSGILQLSSGAPITFVDTRGTLNRSARSGRQTAVSNLTGDQIKDLVGIFERNGNIYFINPSIIDPATGRASNGFGSDAFDGQVFFNVNPGQTGNLPRAIIDGPRFFNVNAALLKNIGFTESTRLQLRMETFNLFNNVNLFNNTQFASITSATFGQITSAGAARTIQFAARFEF